MMKHGLLWGVLIVLALVVGAVGFQAWTAYAQGPGGDQPPCGGGYGYGPGMMMGQGMQNGPMMGRGHMQNGQMGMMHGSMMGQGNLGQNCPFVDDTTWGGMMGGANSMRLWTPPAELAPAGDRVTLDEATAIANAYVATWEDSNLTLDSVLPLANVFYASVVEVDSGRGAFEFLIDPVDGTVFLAPGPSMMWNLRYGGMAGQGMMHHWATPAGADGVEMPVSADDAQAFAQSALDRVEAGLTVGDDVTAFYGYYTFPVLQGDTVIGVVSVNGYSGQVWLHHRYFSTVQSPA